MPLKNVIIHEDPSITGVHGEHIYDGIFLNSCFPASSLDAVKTFDFHDDDVLIAGYPRSGTTWMQEILYLVMTQADIDRALKRDVMERVPLIELGKGYIPSVTPVVEKLARAPPPRLMKTHLPKQFFDNMLSSRQTKVIVVVRNIKDTLVSYYHEYTSHWGLGAYKGSFDDFLQLAKRKQLVHGDWYDFTLGWWNQHENPNVMFITYEDMSRDVSKVIRQVAEFVGRHLTDEHVRIISHHVDFEHLKKLGKRRSGVPCGDWDFAKDWGVTASPLREGKVGQWRKKFSVDNNVEIDREYKQRMAGKGLEIDFTI